MRARLPSALESGPSLSPLSPSRARAISRCGILYVDSQGSYASERSWSLTDADGNVLNSGTGSAGVGISTTVCDGAVAGNPTMPPTATRSGTCYTLVGQDSYGDGWNGAYWTWYVCAGCPRNRLARVGHLPPRLRPHPH